MGGAGLSSQIHLYLVLGFWIVFFKILDSLSSSGYWIKQSFRTICPRQILLDLKRLFEDTEVFRSVGLKRKRSWLILDFDFSAWILKSNYFGFIQDFWIWLIFNRYQSTSGTKMRRICSPCKSNTAQFLIRSKYCCHRRHTLNGIVFFLFLYT